LPSFGLLQQRLPLDNANLGEPTRVAKPQSGSPATLFQNLSSWQRGGVVFGVELTAQRWKAPRARSDTPFHEDVLRVVFGVSEWACPRLSCDDWLVQFRWHDRGARGLVKVSGFEKITLALFLLLAPI
jgi:hypothetical protein